MNKKSHISDAQQKIDSKASTSYVTGFALSILLTLVAYFSVIHHIFDNQLLTFFIIGLALVQLIVQLFFFLHLGKESRPRWNLIFFISTVSVILIVIVGSLWIMNHLNYNMTPMQMNNYILNQEGIKK